MDDFFMKVFGKDYDFSGEQNTEDRISAIEQKLEIKFPKLYRDIILKHNGGYGEIGDYDYELWSIEDIDSFNSTIIGLGDLVQFSSDSIGDDYAFDKHDCSIYLVLEDSCDYKDAKRIADSFENFMIDMSNGEIFDPW